VIRLYHGGTLDEPSDSLWAAPDADYAAAFAQLHEGELWRLTLDVSEGEVRDLTGCELDVVSVVTNLLFAGIPASNHTGDERHPQMVLRRISPGAFRAAGYRVVRVREWIDWGVGERHAESVFIVDLTAIVDREALPLPDTNFQFPDDSPASPPGAGIACPTCEESRADVATGSENEIRFRCDGCGYQLKARAPGNG
jgi:hypothetical protein